MKCACLVLVAALAAAGNASADRLTTVTERAVGDSVKTVDAEIKLAVGKFTIAKSLAANGEVATLSGRYDESKYKYDYFFDRSGKRGDLTFSSELKSHFHTNIDTKDNNWDIAFSPDVELRCNMDIGAADCDIDLGGLSVTELALNVGAAEAHVDFSTPNGKQLSLFKIEAGACDLKVANIGNSRFDRLDFEGGVGSFTLDFSGAFDFCADAEISVGLGSVTIILPETIGVRLEADDSFLSSIDFPKRLMKPVHGREGVYETENYGTAKGQLTVKLDVGMGSADIKFR
jgi:hypothetical protein